jgi:hypothetical protein
MARYISLVFLILLSLVTQAQQFSFSFGVYTGVTGSFTSDEGIKKDPRYEGSFEAKFAPIGINIGLDYEGVGLMVSPGLINVGQNFYVVNTSGGQDGLRKIDLQYLTIPVSFKVHLVQFNAFKLSALASISPAFLLKGTEEVSHRSTKLEFPPAAYSILPSSYTIEYDGVLAPEVDRHSLGEKKDFRSLQLYAGAGFRTDWDPTDHWRISADLRFNYGIFDPRTEQYTKNRESTSSLYAIPGERRDMFAQFTIGISRYIEFEKSEYDRKRKLKGSSRKYRPTVYPGHRSKQSKPKD